MEESVEPDVKRQRQTALEKWCLSPMRRLHDAGDGLDLVSDERAACVSLRDSIQSWVNEIRGKYDGWDAISMPVKDATIILEACTTAVGPGISPLLNCLPPIPPTNRQHTLHLLHYIRFARNAANPNIQREVQLRAQQISESLPQTTMRFNACFRKSLISEITIQPTRLEELVIPDTNANSRLD
jgi:hypothetical protein